MRSLEYLVQLYPDKTGKELLEIQAEEKLAQQKEFEKANKNKLDIINDINTNGGFYKGVFGLTQRFYYSFSNMRLLKGKIYCDCTHVVCFFDNYGIFKCEIREETFKEFENYGIDIYDRVTKEDFNKVVDYFTSSKDLFW